MISGHTFTSSTKNNQLREPTPQLPIRKITIESANKGLITRPPPCGHHECMDP